MVSFSTICVIPVKVGVPKNILLKRKGRKIIIGHKVNKVFLKINKLNFLSLSKLLKKMIATGNNVIKTVTLNKVAIEIIDINLKKLILSR